MSAPVSGRSTALTLSLAVLVCCAAPPAADPEADRAALIAAAEAFHAAAVAKDREAVLALFDPNVIMLPPDGGRIDGSEGVRGFRFGFIETPGVELDFEILEAEVSSDGEMGWTIAIADITIRGPDGIIDRDHVRDFHAWKKQPDGSWRIAVDVWNSGPVGEP